MADVFEKYGDPVLGVIKTDDEGTKKYGIVDTVAKVDKRIYQLNGIVEKPGPEKAPSRLAAIGSYILTPDIFQAIQKLKPGKGGEYMLTDAIQMLAKKRPLYACELEGEYHDTGSKIGWLKANLAVALRREDMRDQMRGWKR